MLHKIFINTQQASQRIGVDRRTIYRWLEGTTPKTENLILAVQYCGIDATVSYAIDFFNIVSRLNKCDNIDHIKHIISDSILKSNDKKFLYEHFKTRHWKKIS